MRKLPPLNAIRAFEAVARNGSFTAAAQELCVTTTAISHQIRHLEELLGVRLLDRNTRRVALSPAGERIFPLIRDGFDRLADAFTEIADRGAGGAIAVTTTQAFAERWLLPRLTRFHSLCPGVMVNVSASEAVVDLRVSGLDLAIRYGREPDAGLKRVLLFEDRYVPVVAREAAPEAAPLLIHTFARTGLIGFRWKNPALGGPTWARWFEVAGIDDDRAFRINWFGEEHLALQALDHGHGPLLASDVMVASGLGSGRYLRVEGPSLPGLAFHAILAPTAGRKPSVRAFLDWLQEEAAATARGD